MWTSGAITVSLCEVMSSSKRRMPSILTSLVTGRKYSKFDKFFAYLVAIYHSDEFMFLMAFCSVVLGSSGCCSLADGCDGGARAAGLRLDGMTPIRLMPLETGLSLLSTKGNEANYYSKLEQKYGNVYYTWCCRGVESAETSAGGRSHLVSDSKRRTKRPIDFWRADGNLPNPRRRPPRRRTNFLLLLPRKRKAVSPEPDCGRHADSCPHLAAGRPDAAGRHLVNNPAQLPATAPV